MPIGWDQQAVYLQSGDPETENTPTLHAPGLLGSRFTVNNPRRRSSPATVARSKRYQLVRLDPASTPAAETGAPAYWSDKSLYMVTTAVANKGQIAGILRLAVTVGNYCCVQIGGPGTVKILDTPTAAPTVAGLPVVPSATATRADALAAGAAASPLIGVTAGTQDGTSKLALVNIDIPETT